MRIANERLAKLRSGFSAQLDVTVSGAHDLAAFGRELRVDPVRGAISAIEDETYWTRNEHGAAILRNDSGGMLLFMGAAVGRSRHFTAGQFVDFTATLCADTTRCRYSAMDLSCYLNLIVAEPVHRPERELAIWANIAWRMAGGSEQENLFADLPGLVTGHDVRYARIPPGTEFMESVLPPPPDSPSFSAFEADLLVRIFPDTAAEVAAAGDDSERSAVFTGNAHRLRPYIRDHVFGAVAALLN